MSLVKIVSLMKMMDLMKLVKLAKLVKVMSLLKLESFVKKVAISMVRIHFYERVGWEKMNQLKLKGTIKLF